MERMFLNIIVITYKDIPRRYTMFELNSFGQENSFLDLFNNMEKNFFTHVHNNFFSQSSQFYDEGSHYLLQVELPGYAKEDISIETNNRTLRVTAKKQASFQPDDLSSSDFEHAKSQYQQHLASGYSHTFDMSSVDTYHIEAKYDNGLLQLYLPKNEDLDQVRKIDLY